MGSLPAFPHFAHISLSHKDVLRSIAKRFPPYSDFNFVSLFTWDTREVAGVALLNDNLIVRFGDYASDGIFLSLLGTQKLPETIAALFAYCRQARLDSRLQLVPHSVIEALPPDLAQQYDIHEDRDDHDYLLSTAAVARRAVALNKRRAVQRFEKQYKNRFHSRSLDLSSDTAIAEIRDVITRWTMTRTNTPGQDQEAIALERCLAHVRELDIEAYGTYVDERLVSFIFFEMVSSSTTMMHYGKSDHSFAGASDFTKVATAAYLQNIGISYINLEQDTGVEGLRRDKAAYLPVDFLRKFSISEKRL